MQEIFPYPILKKQVVLEVRAMDEDAAMQKLSELRKPSNKTWKEPVLTLKAYEKYLEENPRAKYPYMSTRDFNRMQEEQNKKI